MTDRCKYCRKDLADGGCRNAHAANQCPNGHPDVKYADRVQQTRQLRRLLGNLANPEPTT